MWFVIYAEDVSESEPIRAPLRAEHMARREALDRERRVLASGPLSEQLGKPYSGSLLIADFASLEDARAWALADPYAMAGVYKRLTVKHFNQHFPSQPRG